MDPEADNHNGLGFPFAVLMSLSESETIFQISIRNCGVLSYQETFVSWRRWLYRNQILMTSLPKWSPLNRNSNASLASRNTLYTAGLIFYYEVYTASNYTANMR
jgi:hypothetical protein